MIEGLMGFGYALGTFAAGWVAGWLSRAIAENLAKKDTTP